MNIFKSKRIIYSDISEKPRFSMCEPNYYTDNTVYNTNCDSYAVLGLLNSSLFNFFVILPLPLLLVYLFVSIDGLYVKYLVQELSVMMVIGNIIQIGLMLATAGTNAGHELIHRARNSLHEEFGYWLLALNFDTAFVIEHLHGHHKFVGTINDPSTARYNENTYLFIIRSTIGTIKNSWKWEKSRMINKGKNILSLENKLISGFLKGLLIMAESLI